MKRLIIFGHVINLQFVLVLGVFQDGGDSGMWRNSCEKRIFFDRFRRFLGRNRRFFSVVFNGIRRNFDETVPFKHCVRYPAPPPCQGVALFDLWETVLPLGRAPNAYSEYGCDKFDSV